jgi:hypothetical protein
VEDGNKSVGVGGQVGERQEREGGQAFGQRLENRGELRRRRGRRGRERRFVIERNGFD